MVRGRNNNLVIVLISITLLYSVIGVHGLSYDYTAITECLAKPHKAQYGGGIIKNPEFENGLKGWSNFGNAKIQHRESNGNKFIVAHSRNNPWDSASQKLYLKKDHIYTFSAWIRVSVGEKVPIIATFKSKSGLKQAGSILAESKCWSFLKGGLSVEDSAPAELYFESNDMSVEIWVDSISLQPFTQSQWQSHQVQSIQKVRKSNVRIKVVNSKGQAVPNATLLIRPNGLSFPFGCAMNKNILSNPRYREWYTSRGFTVTTFEDEMKWYSNEPSQNREDYSSADAMLQLARQHGISVRAHNIFWDDPTYEPNWVKPLWGQPLWQATWKRFTSITSRYRGQVVAWDVVNENLHNGFFEGKLGQNASASFYNWAFKADSGATMFLNEYNTIENPGDARASPSSYLGKLREIQAYPGNVNGRLGIGLEAHFGSWAPNLGYVRSAIDVLVGTGLPVWITELDVSKNTPNQAIYLEQYLRELHSHPGIRGIVMWSAWNPQGCWQMCLTDNDFNNLATGNVVDKLLHEWGYRFANFRAKTDASGHFDTSLFHGHYDVKIVKHSDDQNNNSDNYSRSFSVAPKGKEISKSLIQLRV